MSSAGTRSPRNLRVGLVILAVLAGAALLAPMVATDLPWLTRGPGGWSSPAAASFIGLDFAPAAEVRERMDAPIPHHPNHLNLGQVLAEPSRHHWLGTDALGRDLAARVLHGGRVSLSVGLLAAALSLFIGVPIGALAGYRGGFSDAAISRVIEAVLCFPALLLALVILATAPGWLHQLSDVLRIALVLALTGWIPVARYLRAEFLKLRESEMVAAARAMGSGHARIVWRHILPCSLAPVLVTGAFAVGGAVALEAALSFLGLGVRPPVSTWGGLLADAKEHVDSAWWLALFPGAALFLTVLGCNLIGEGLRDLLDPRRKQP